MSNTETANRKKKNNNNKKKKKKKKLSVTLTPWRRGGGGMGLYSSESLEGGVSPGSPHPDPISDQNMSFSTPVLRPDL